MPYHTELGADVRPWQEWTDWEKWKFLQEHGPEEFARLTSPEGIPDVSDIAITQLPVYEGSPERLRGAYGYRPTDKAAETIERINRERDLASGRQLQMPPPRHTGAERYVMPEKTLSEFTDEDEFEYEFFDVQQEAARKKKDLDRLNLLSNRQLAEMIDAERAKTDKLGGGIYSVVTGKSYQRSTPTTSYDAAKMRGAAAQSPNVSSIEIQEIWKRWYELDKKGQAPSTDAEVDAFIEAVNPSDKGWDFIQNKLFPEYDLGKWKPMFKLLADGSLHTIYRRENADKSEELAGGYKLSIPEINLQRQMAGEKVAGDLLSDTNDAMTRARNAHLAGNLNTNKDLKKFFATNNITDYRIINEVQGAYPHLVSENDIVYLQKDGKIEGFPKYKVGQKTKEGWVSTDVAKIQNQQVISDAVARQVQVSLKGGAPGSPIVSEHDTLAAVTNELRKLNIPFDPSDLATDVKAVYGKATRLADKKLKDTNNLRSKKFAGWTEFEEAVIAGDYHPDAVEAISKQLERENPEWKYTGNRIWYNESGEVYEGPLDTYRDVIQAQKTHPYESIKDVPHPPVYELDMRDMPTEAGTHLMVYKEREPVAPGEYGDFVEKSGYFHNIGKEQELIKDYRTAGNPDFASHAQIEKHVVTVLFNLEQGNSLHDIRAIRELEKIQDPTGVIRASDVDIIMANISGWSAGLEKKLTAFGTGQKITLLPEERDEIASVALIAYKAHRVVMQQNLLDLQSEIDLDPYKVLKGTKDGRAIASKIGVFDVFSTRKWNRLMKDHGLKWVRVTGEVIGSTKEEVPLAEQSAQDIADTLFKKKKTN